MKGTIVKEEGPSRKRIFLVDTNKKPRTKFSHSPKFKPFNSTQPF